MYDIYMVLNPFLLILVVGYELFNFSFKGSHRCISATEDRFILANSAECHSDQNSIVLSTRGLNAPVSGISSSLFAKAPM